MVTAFPVCIHTSGVFTSRSSKDVSPVGWGPLWYRFILGVCWGTMGKDLLMWIWEGQFSHHRNEPKSRRLKRVCRKRVGMHVIRDWKWCVLWETIQGKGRVYSLHFRCPQRQNKGHSALCSLNCISGNCVQEAAHSQCLHPLKHCKLGKEEL